MAQHLTGLLPSLLKIFYLCTYHQAILIYFSCSRRARQIYAYCTISAGGKIVRSATLIILLTLDSAAILILDHLLTFDSEVSFIWGRRFTGATLLFILNRYTTLIKIIIGFSIDFTHSSMVRICSALPQSSSPSYLTRILGVSAYLADRVHVTDVCVQVSIRPAVVQYPRHRVSLSLRGYVSLIFKLRSAHAAVAFTAFRVWAIWGRELRPFLLVLPLTLVVPSLNIVRPSVMLILPRPLDAFLQYRVCLTTTYMPAAPIGQHFVTCMDDVRLPISLYVM